LGFSGGKYKPFFRDCKVEIAKLWFRLASLSFASLCQNGIPDRWQERYFGANGKLLLKKRSHFNRAIVILLVYFSVCLQI